MTTGQGGGHDYRAGRVVHYIDAVFIFVMASRK